MPSAREFAHACHLATRHAQAPLLPALLLATWRYPAAGLALLALRLAGCHGECLAAPPGGCEPAQQTGSGPPDLSDLDAGRTKDGLWMGNPSWSP